MESNGRAKKYSKSSILDMAKVVWLCYVIKFERSKKLQKKEKLFSTPVDTYSIVLHNTQI